jgi:hypothetical protein
MSKWVHTDELIQAVKLVLEWHDENLSDGVDRENSIRALRDAYDNFHHYELKHVLCPDCGFSVSVEFEIEK